MGKLRPRGGRTLLKPYSDQVCSYDSQTFFTNSTNTNSNNFNLLEVDDVSMSVPNLRFSAPDDKEKDKRILFSRFICDSLCQTNLESKSSCPGHEITHTHTHTHTYSIQYYWVPCRWLISHQEKSPPEGRDLPLYPSIKLNTLHQSSFCTWTLYFPLPAPLTSLGQLSLRQQTVFLTGPSIPSGRQPQCLFGLGTPSHPTRSYASVIGLIFPQDPSRQSLVSSSCSSIHRMLG